ncbi:Lrp/AsnC family transcriptional regulator [Candidatus Pacearchaeota archaeon]|nr:Lrp/AsnC family transcriptional regulator [Candidatus Pacearchaeota archaeon]
MKSKLKKLVYEYTKNSRITTKELGKRIGASQQSASYLLSTLKKKKMIESPTTIIDAVKFGYINILTGAILLKTDQNTKKDILDELKTISFVTGIEEFKEGIDFIVEYVVPNLSAFNKINLDLIEKFSNKMRIVFVYPIIVVHEYNKNYLVRNFEMSDKILFSDNEKIEVSNQELIILKELIKNPERKLIDIAESTNIPIKTVIKIKKEMERKNIIKGYTSILNNGKLGINREVILLKFPGEGIKEIDKFMDYAKNNKHIVKCIKIIGEYQVAVTIESDSDLTIIKEIRENFPIENYRIMKSEKIHKKIYLPLIE